MYNPYEYGTKKYYLFELNKAMVHVDMLQIGASEMLKNAERYSREERQMTVDILSNAYDDVNELDKKLEQFENNEVEE